MKYKTYKLESTFIGHERKSDTMINGQPEYAAIYTAHVEIYAGIINFTLPIKGRYWNSFWKDTEEDQQNLKEMMLAAIRSGEAEEF